MNQRVLGIHTAAVKGAASKTQPAASVPCLATYMVAHDACRFVVMVKKIKCHCMTT